MGGLVQKVSLMYYTEFPLEETNGNLRTGCLTPPMDNKYSQRGSVDYSHYTVCSMGFVRNSSCSLMKGYMLYA